MRGLPALDITPFHPEDAMPLVRMWRESFEFGVGITDPHPISEQLDYFRGQVLPRYNVRIARAGDLIVGFLATDAQSIAQLYVRIQNIGQGIGTQLLNLAKAQSIGSLWLHTFQRNQRARHFYEQRGFRAAATGFEPMWQLADIRYEWSAQRECEASATAALQSRRDDPEA